MACAAASTIDPALLMQTAARGFPFMKHRRVAMTASALACVIAILSIVFHGMNYGIDFTGGMVVEVAYSSEANLEQIRSDLEDAGIHETRVQTVGGVSNVMIRLPPPTDSSTLAQTRDRVVSILSERHPDIQLRGAEVVSNQVGEDLAEDSGLALLFALIMIFIYVMLRFRWKLALGAIIATLHDVIITAGVFSLLDWQFDLTVLGSMLAVLGYSLNDTIVVYDRIRDNFRHMRRGSPSAIVDASVNQTLGRTLVTGVTSLLVLVALTVLGGDTLWGFSVALIIGIVVGTYSSIYVASAMALALKVTPADLLPRKSERADELP
jgi:preprotein translocase subunit SecF